MKIQGSIFTFGLLTAIGFSQITDPVIQTGIRCSATILSVPGVSTDCIDVSQPGDVSTEYTLTSNTNMIEVDGLRMCVPPAPPVENRQLTVIFLVDMSGSMWGIDCGGCENDPDFDAPKAVAVAMQSIRDSIPGSLVGFAGFSGGVCDATYTGEDGIGAGARFEARGTVAANTVVNPIPISVEANYDLLRYQTDYDINNFYFSCGTNGGGTWYFAPLKNALDMFAAVRPANPDNKEIIIFVTDGDPNGGSDLDSFDSLVTAVVDNGDPFPETHAVFINGTNNDLRDLAEASGGGLINVSNADQIGEILTNIVSENTIRYYGQYETSIEYLAGGVSILQTVQLDTVGAAALNNGELDLVLPNAIPLVPGANLITLTANSGGTIHRNNVTLNVTDPPRLTAGSYPNPSPSPFVDVCVSTASIHSGPSQTGFSFSLAGRGVVYHSDELKVERVKVYNTSGKLITSIDVSSSKTVWQVPDNMQGLYLVEVIHATGREYNKITIW